MADRCLMITWGQVVRGREERALENFNEVLGYYGRLQQEGKIESFDTVLCQPNGHLNGYIQLNGSAEQLADAREEDEFQRILAESALIVDDLRVIDGVCNEGVAQQVDVFQKAVAKVPQSV